MKQMENHYLAVLRVLFFRISRFNPLYILGGDVQCYWKIYNQVYNS